MIKGALPVHGTSWQYWLIHHCRLEIQTDSVAEDNAVGLSHQWLEIQTGSVAEDNIVGLSYQPVVMARPTQLA